MMPIADRIALRDEAKRLGARRVLEFGPGLSTFAFLDAGAMVMTLEHDDHWFEHAVSKFGKLLRVKVLRYENLPVVQVPELNGDTFDLAFVDSPQGYDSARVEHPGQEGMNRMNTVRYALSKAPVVLLHDAHRKGERATLDALGGEGYEIEHVVPDGRAKRRGRIARILQPHPAPYATPTA